MGTVNVTLGEDTILNVMVGQQDENEVREVVFDFSDWYTTYGSGTISLAIQRPKDEWPYEGTLTVDNSTHKATWEISDTDSAYAGVGQIQLSYTVGTAVKKSVVYRFTVHKSLGALGSVITPIQIQTFIDEVTEALEDMQEELADVKEDLDSIKKSGTIKASEYLKDILSNMMQLFEAVSLYNDTVDVAQIGAETNELIENLEVATLILTGIDVVFNQTDIIYSNASLDDLRQYLTVTAMYDDGSSRTTTAYTLSGTIATGTQTFTVTLGNFTKTFDAVITKAVIDYTQFIMYQLPDETVFDGTNVIDTGIKPVSADNDYNWTIMSKVSLDGANWSKPLFGWEAYAVASGYTRVGVKPITQAGYKRIQFFYNDQSGTEDTTQSTLSGNQDINVAIIHDANGSSTRFIVHWNGDLFFDRTLTDVYKKYSTLKLYLGNTSNSGNFIGTIHDFVMYNTIVDTDTINTYLEE